MVKHQKVIEMKVNQELQAGVIQKSGDIEIAASYPKMDPLDKLLKDIDDVDRKFKNKRPGTRPGKGRGMGDTWEGPGKIV